MDFQFHSFFLSTGILNTEMLDIRKNVFDLINVDILLVTQFQRCVGVPRFVFVRVGREVSGAMLLSALSLFTPPKKNPLLHDASKGSTVLARL